MVEFRHCVELHTRMTVFEIVAARAARVEKEWRELMVSGKGSTSETVRGH